MDAAPAPELPITPSTPSAAYPVSIFDGRERLAETHRLQDPGNSVPMLGTGFGQKWSLSGR